MTKRHARSHGRQVVRAVAGAILAAVLALGAWEVGSGRWQAHPVLTGSMRPGFAVGSVALVERVPVKSLSVRDVIVVQPPGYGSDQFIHRIISMTPSAGGTVIRTQGDANAVPDPWSVTITSPYAYRARLSIPWVGYAALAVHSPLGRRITLAVALALLVSSMVLRLRGRKARAERATGTAADGEGGDVATPANVVSIDSRRNAGAASAGAGTEVAVEGE